MNPTICTALHAVVYRKGTQLEPTAAGLEFAEWSLFNLADVAHYRSVDLGIESKYNNLPDADQDEAEWEPEDKWRKSQPVLDALLTGYDNEQFTAYDLVHTALVLQRRAAMINHLYPDTAY